jgi:CheY-like chemotaxis protein
MEKQPKVILMSSWDMPSSEHHSMVDAFLPKPIKPSSLHDTIMKAYGKTVARRARGGIQRIGAADLGAIRGARVLVVDDSDINLQIACELLEKIPLVLDTACNGLEAVEKVKLNHYEVVLMDIQMPIMDGYAATAKIREDERFRDLPIWAMTANVMAEDKARTESAGMNGHVGKPIDPPELYRALITAIPEADYSANLAGLVESSEASEEPAVPLPDSLPGLEISRGLGRVGGNEKLYRKLLAELVAEYSSSHTTLESLLQDNRNEDARKTAHKLRGIANNLGAAGVGSSAEAIEQSLLAGEEVSSDKLVALQNALEELAESQQTLGLAAVEMMPAAGGVDVVELLDQLEESVKNFDPAAADTIEQLVAAVGADGEPGRLLVEAGKMLDNFNFTDAEPLLVQVRQQLG